MAKKKKKVKEKPLNDFFVGIEDPNQIRKIMLECLKDSIELLKKYESFKRTRAEKLALTLECDGTTKDLKKGFALLKTMLPKAEVQLESSKPSLQEIKQDVVKPVKPVPHRQSELERLQRELNEVEGKINSLG